MATLHQQPPQELRSAPSQSAIASGRNTSQTPPSQPSKPRALVRRITSKLRGSSTANAPRKDRDAAGTAPVPASNLPNSMVGKSAREQALRERGLLPPLAPNKDLSVQEKEQDRQLDKLAPHTTSETSGSELSAAELIKRQYEKKSSPSLPTLPEISASSTTSPSLPAVHEGPEESDVLTTAMNTPLPPSPVLPSCEQLSSITPPSSVPPLLLPVAEASDEFQSCRPVITIPSPSETESDAGASIATPSLSADSHVPSVQSSSSSLPKPRDTSVPINETFTPTPIISESIAEEGINTETVTANTETHLPEKSESSPVPSPVVPSPSQAEGTPAPGKERKEAGKEAKPSVTASLTSLRRTLTRARIPKAAPSQRSTSAPQMLSRSQSLMSRGKASPVIDAPKRLARSPVVHSLGSILQETAEIEDEESRRLSEMCFLD